MDLSLNISPQGLQALAPVLEVHWACTYSWTCLQPPRPLPSTLGISRAEHVTFQASQKPWLKAYAYG